MKQDPPNITICHECENEIPGHYPRCAATPIGTGQKYKSTDPVSGEVFWFTDHKYEECFLVNLVGTCPKYHKKERQTTKRKPWWKIW